MKYFLLKNHPDWLWLLNGYCGFEKVKQLVHEVHHSSPPSANVTNGCSYISSPLICLMALTMTTLIYYMIFLINLIFQHRISNGFLLNEVSLQWIPHLKAIYRGLKHSLPLNLGMCHQFMEVQARFFPYFHSNFLFFTQFLHTDEL